MPSPIFPKSYASPSIVAYIMNQKYVEGLPLYRQESQLKYLGIGLSRQTLSNWMVEGADRWLATLYNRMRDHLIQEDIMHADETRSEEHTSELQSRGHLVCRLLLEKKK